MTYDYLQVVEIKVTAGSWGVKPEDIKKNELIALLLLKHKTYDDILHVC